MSLGFPSFNRSIYLRELESRRLLHVHIPAFGAGRARANVLSTESGRIIALSFIAFSFVVIVLAG